MPHWILQRMMLALLFAPVPAAQTPLLTVNGDVETRLSLSIDDFRGMPHQKVKIEQQGRRVVYEHVPLVEVLRRAGVNVGRAPVQGKALGSAVFVTGADGFHALFALAELDPVQAAERVLLVDARDGQRLPAAEGPLRLIAPGDKYPPRWVRRVARVMVAYVDPPK